MRANLAEAKKIKETKEQESIIAGSNYEKNLNIYEDRPYQMNQFS